MSNAQEMTIFSRYIDNNATTYFPRNIITKIRTISYQSFDQYWAHVTL